MNHWVGELRQKPGSLTWVTDEISGLALVVSVVEAVVSLTEAVTFVGATTVRGMVVTGVSDSMFSDSADKSGWDGERNFPTRVGSEFGARG